MAERATEACVSKILDETVTGIEAFITAANLLLEKITSGCGYSEEYLTILECWLTAHFVAVSQKTEVEMEKLGPAQTKFAFKTGKGLNSTRYGQQVIALDTCGKFRNLGKQAAIVVTAFDVDDA